MGKIILWLIILALLFLNGFVAYTVLEHYEGFSNDPLVYGARLYGLDSCSCWRGEQQFSFNQTAVSYIKEYKSYKGGEQYGSP